MINAGREKDQLEKNMVLKIAASQKITVFSAISFLKNDSHASILFFPEKNIVPIHI